MPLTSPARRFPFFRRGPVLALGLLVVVGAASIGWRTFGPHGDLPDDPLVLQVLAGAGHRDDALAYLAGQADTGAVLARRALGLALLERDGRAAEGIDWLRKAAAAGDTEARFGLGKLYMKGAPGVAVDRAAALRFLSEAARDRHPGAAYYLGIAYRDGYGVRPDQAEAVRWFRHAADANVAAALFLLGNAYREGEGVARDDATAVRYYEQAAELDHPEAIQTLAMAYRNGEMGLPRDDARYLHYVAEVAHALKHPALTP